MLARRVALTEADLALIVNGIAHLVWISAPDGAVTYANKRVAAYFGPADGGREPTWDFRPRVQPDDAGPASREWARARRTATAFVGDCRIRRFDGQYRWHSFQIDPIKGEQGTISGWLGTATDIDDAKQQETRLRCAEQINRQLAAIVAQSDEAIMGSTNAGIGTSWNHAAERLLGYAAEEIIGHRVPMLAPGAPVDEQALVRARIVAGGPAERYEATRRRKDGSLVDVLVTSSPATDEAGNVIGVSVIILGATERSMTGKRSWKTTARWLRPSNWLRSAASKRT